MANRRPLIDYKKIYLPFITLLVMSVIFSIYLFLFVSKKEKEIQQRNFRVLGRIEQNLGSRIEDTYRLALSRFSMIDTAEKRNENIYKIAEAGGFILSETKESDSIKDKWWIDIESGEGKVFFVNEKGPHDKVLSVPLKKIISPILRGDVFEQCMILKGGEVLYNDFPAVNEITEDDSLFGSEKFFLSLSIKQIEAGKINYYAFIKPFSFKGEKDFAIIGWVTASGYNKEKYTVPGNYLLGVLLVLFFMLLSFPFLKSLLMSKFETLDSIDVVATVLSLFMICYAVTYTFNFGFSYLNLDRKNQKKLLVSINDKIEKSFLTELDSIYFQMSLYDTLYSSNVYQQMSCANVLDKVNSENLNINDSVYPVKNLAVYRHFKYNFWLDENGQDVCNWTTNVTVPPLENYSTRNYFKNIKSKSWWFLHGNRNMPFTMEAVNSWSDGTFRAVVARPSISQTAVAMSSYMPSLINPILPPEIEYCLIDKEGNVLIHSDLKRSLNENLFDECNSNSDLRAAVFSRTNTFCKEHYMGKDTRLYISPIENLPLFLVTINDRQYIDSINLATFVFTFFHILIILLVVIVTILVLIFLRRRNHILQDRLFNIKWLYPSFNHINLYKTICTFNIIVLVITFFFSQQITDNPISIGFLFCMNALFTTVSFFYTKLSFTELNRKFLLYASAIFLFIADLIVYELNDNINVLIFNISYQLLNFWFLKWINKDKFTENTVLQYVAKPVNSMMLAIRKKQNSTHGEKAVRVKRRNGVYGLYSFMLVTWLALVAVVPAYRLHQLFYTEEHEVLLKYMQLQTASRISSNFNYKSGSSLPYFKLLNDSSETNRISNVYLRDYYNTILRAKEIPVASNKSEGSFFNTYANYVRVTMSEIETYYHRLSSPEKRDSTLRFVMHIPPGGQPMLQLQITNLGNSMPGLENRLIIENKMPFYSPVNANSKEWFSSFKISVAYILSIILFFIGLYAFVLFFLKRFFLAGYIPENPGKESVDETKSNVRKKFLENDLRLFVTGVPSAGKHGFINDAIADLVDYVKKDAAVKKEESLSAVEKKIVGCNDAAGFWKKHVACIDLAEYCYINEDEEEREDAEKVAGDKKKSPGKRIKRKNYPAQELNDDTLIVILRYFDFGLADADFIEKKYRLISDILKNKNYGIIISSALHPSVYLKSLKVIAEEKKENDDKQESEPGLFKAQDYITNSTYYKWSTMLSGFYIYTHALMEKSRHADDQFLSEKAEQDTYKAHHLGYTYYYAMWSSLPGAEKFVLYDLAEDNLANFNNREAIISLQQKGLITVNDYPEINDDSFRNFILTEVSDSDIKAERKSGETESSWVKFKIPFLIVIVAVLFFVFSTQEDTFFKAVSAITAFMGGISVFSKFIGGTKSVNPE